MLCGRMVYVCYSTSAKLYRWACGSNEDGAPCSFLFNFVCPLEVQLACSNTQTTEVKEIFLLKNILCFQWFFLFLFFLLLCSSERRIWAYLGLSGHFCPLNFLFWMGARALTVHTIPSALCVINCSFWGLCSFSCQWQHWCVLWDMTTCSLGTQAVLPKTSSCLGLWLACGATGNKQGWWLQNEAKVGEQAGGSGPAAVTRSSCDPCSTLLSFSLPVELYLENCFCWFVCFFVVSAASLMPKTSQDFTSSICTMTGAQATYILANRGVFKQTVVSHQAVGSYTSQIRSSLIPLHVITSTYRSAVLPTPR